MANSFPSSWSKGGMHCSTVGGRHHTHIWNPWSTAIRQDINLLSFLMKDICRMLGIDKLNTTASHPECNGAVEKFDRTLKTMLRKLGLQWDQCLSGVLSAYCNRPHSTTGEKPSYLLFGLSVALQLKQHCYQQNHLQSPTLMTIENCNEQNCLHIMYFNCFICT